MPKSSKKHPIHMTDEEARSLTAFLMSLKASGAKEVAKK